MLSSDHDAITGRAPDTHMHTLFSNQPMFSKPTDALDFMSMTGIDRRQINGPLDGARNMTMLGLIGSPRGTYDAECRPPTNPRIAAMMEQADFGPFSAIGLRPAIRALTTIMGDIRTEQPAIYDVLGTTGMLCCRLVRGSSTAISNHSWGTAIDLTVDGMLAHGGHTRMQNVLLTLQPIFNRRGFFWGAAFQTEEPMHFEASDQLIHAWSEQGEFGSLPTEILQGLSVGDRGMSVEKLQLALNEALLPMALEVDGIFGKDTRACVVEFQRRSGLPVNGIASEQVRRALGFM
jgi:hypothetical protein